MSCDNGLGASAERLGADGQAGGGTCGVTPFLGQRCSCLFEPKGTREGTAASKRQLVRRQGRRDRQRRRGGRAPWQLPPAPATPQPCNATRLQGSTLPRSNPAHLAWRRGAARCFRCASSSPPSGLRQKGRAAREREHVCVTSAQAPPAAAGCCTQTVQCTPVDSLPTFRPAPGTDRRRQVRAHAD